MCSVSCKSVFIFKQNIKNVFPARCNVAQGGLFALDLTLKFSQNPGYVSSVLFPEKAYPESKKGNDSHKSFSSNSGIPTKIFQSKITKMFLVYNKISLGGFVFWLSNQTLDFNNLFLMYR